MKTLQEIKKQRAKIEAKIKATKAERAQSEEAMAKLEETKKAYNELAEKINALSVGAVNYIQKIY